MCLIYVEESLSKQTLDTYVCMYVCMDVCKRFVVFKKEEIPVVLAQTESCSEPSDERHSAVETLKAINDGFKV